ncbi:DHA2 family efflux MFS transporter permease subunit [Nonomuraea fuscirosea]|jgi:EmrB/QacA subfamily drug resistance transporter|uniref:DHA2 family efflux MFS transporter permease subunit n=1 Tax=Nonomuraea fuscirosea TaxID=1291556 RepID=UPI002DD9A7C3|nr:DHA2 family efflux MFS transporter permease subunit [Nonomuraea fuscirosea]WSA52347.1 DHA2 family efflux MFS transporter permease subunit [Nonomuraea fuscirosea]
MRWWALAAVTLGTFMTYLDNNVGNVALPTIQRDLGLTISGLEWIVSSYILVFAGLMLVGGRLADVYGARRVFLGGLTVFTLASLAAGLATSGGMLVAARAVQGVGAALLTPTALALISQIFPDPAERGRAVGVWSMAGALSMALGPVVGGFISENLHWGWIYLVNVPIGVVTAGLALWAVRPAFERVRHHLDVPGLVTSAVALFALTYALIEGESAGWTSPEILAAAGVFVLAAVAFVLAESRAAEPMVAVSLFRSRVFSGGLLTSGIWSFGVFGIYFFSALWLQNVLGFTPTQAGASFVPMALTMAVVALLSQRISAALGIGRTVALGMALMGAAIFLISRVGADGGFADVAPWFLLYGLGGGLLVPLTSAVLGGMPKARAGVASGVLNVSREVFGLLGITVLGAFLSSRQSGSDLPPLPAFLDAYQFTLVIAAAVVVAAIPIALYSLRDRAEPDEPQAAAPVTVGSSN